MRKKNKADFVLFLWVTIFVSCIDCSDSTMHDNIISNVKFRNHFTPKEIKEAILNNNEVASCVLAAWILQSLQKHYSLWAAE